MIELPLINEKIIAYSTEEYFTEYNERYLIRVYYYEQCNNIIIALLKILTFGIYLLFENWFISIKLLNYRKSYQPSHLLIQKLKDNKRMNKDELIECSRDGERIKFIYEYIRYIITQQNQLQKLELQIQDYQELTKYQAQQRQILYGENIMQINERSKSSLLINEILSPFNVFQIFSFIVWSLDDYYLFAILIAILTIIQIGISLYDLQQQNHKIRQMIYYETTVIVHRDNLKYKISSKDLVPGDIVEINNNQILTYDGQLIKGDAVFNESILTGESTPILKNNNMQIFSGCTCLTASQDCLGIVQSISFNTIKGSLARYILFNNTYSYSFQRESLKYLFVLGIIGIILAIINYFIRLQSTQDNFGSIIEALEILTIMIPPSLPTAIGSGLQVAIYRLKQNNIYCIKPDKINVSGMINLIGFDKTGTLTENTLHILGCIENKSIIQPNHTNELLQLAMKSCHSLIGGCGDSLETAMLECCNKQYNFEYLKVYQFEAHLQRMTVIIQYQQKILAITKGSPEIMERLCYKTLPNHYNKIITQYTSEGYRLITFGYKELQNTQQERQYIENGLQYLGILIFINNLREDSIQLIQQLNNININVIMVTGDNILTSINIAKQCNILDPNKPVIKAELKNNKLIFDENRDQIEIEQMDYQIALTGDCWEYANQVYYHSILSKTKVFARMKPQQKGNLMLKLKSFNNKYIFTAFVGDGCNDICALQQSDIGLALSTQEASLAAPFLTPILKSSQIIEILKSGRCCLITSQSCFKFMTVYSSIQTVALTLCYIANTNFTVYQFLYQDLWIIVPISFTMSLTQSSQQLTQNKPFVSLLQKSIILSVILQFLICSITQIIQFLTYDLLQITIENKEQKNQINTQQIILANTQVLAIAIAYSQGKPFRQPIYKNIYLIIVIIIAMIVHIYLIIEPNFILSSLSYDQIIKLGIFNLIVFISIILFENMCIKQYQY